MSEAVVATYAIETAHDLHQASQVMAREQSSGTFVKLPGETPELLARHGAKIIRITELETVNVPSLPCFQRARGTRAGETIRRAEIVISFPFDNIGASLTTLMTTVSGNLFELAQFTGVKLLDLDIPHSFSDHYAGPQFGITGTRELARVYDRPLIGTIIKPSVGLSPAETAELVQTLCEAGLDFIKDDELQTNSPHSQLKHRIEAVMRVINDYAETTGKKVMVAFNITGDLDEMKHGHDLVLNNGGTCVMVNMLAVGLVGLIELRKHSQLPIHGHRAGWGLYYRSPAIGISYVAFQKLMRLAGVDHLHVNGLQNKFCESDASVVAAAKAVLTPLFGGYEAMPIFSSGQWAGQVADTYAALGSTDLMYVAGGGIFAHPDGIKAGVQSLRQAWDATVQHIPLDEYARDHIELKHALEKYAV